MRAKFLNQILIGNACDVLPTIPRASVDCITSSPPYLGPRKYSTPQLVWDETTACEHDFSIKVPPRRKATPGDIPGPNSKIASRRTIAENRPWEESFFCSRCGAWKGHWGLEPTVELYMKHTIFVFDDLLSPLLKPTGTMFVNIGDSYYKKSLQGIPARFQVAMLERGWLCRNYIAWDKQAPMPSSNDDNFTPSWEAVFFLTKQKQYNFQQQYIPLKSKKTKKSPPIGGVKKALGDNRRYSGNTTDMTTLPGRNMPDVWHILPSKYKGQHHATYPFELVKRMILAGSPEGYCKACGKPHLLIKDKIVKCGCNADVRPAVVLDPCGGVGTTAITAEALNRDWIMIDLSKEYARLTKARMKKMLPVLRQTWRRVASKNTRTLDRFLLDARVSPAQDLN